MSYVLNFISYLLQPVPDIIFAAILLIIAFVAASVVKALVMKLLKAVNAEKYLNRIGIKDTATESSAVFLAKLAYFVTFLLFLPGVLDKLGMQSVSLPITGMVNSFLAFIPRLVGAAIIVAVGMFIANIVKELLISVLKAVKVDALQGKAGIEATEGNSFSSIIANVVYGIIVLIVIVSALEQLGIAAISAPANVVVSAIFGRIPSVLAAIVIIAAGVFIARLVAKLLENLLAGVGADGFVEKLTGSSEKKIALSRIISETVKYVLVIIFLVQGINVLDLPVLTEIGAAVIGYMPAVLSVVIIIAVGMFAANTAESALGKKFPKAKAGALTAKVAIYVLTAFLSLSQLGVANRIVETTFILIVAALCVAFAIAFGVGGRGFAADTLDKLEKKLDEDEKK